ncbi:MAG: hypothetical protein JJ902_04060 [Roseibium sp.]|nr:hypothetical protein [Roseibium sp.]
MLKKVEFKPDVFKDDTELTAESAYVDAQWVRFRRGKPQIMGGTEEKNASTFTGLARGAHSWQDNDGNKIVAWGTHNKLYAEIGGSILDITPNQAEGSLTNPFATESGSTTVTVTLTQHGLAVGDSITFSHALPFAGITVDGSYTIVSVVNADKFTITHSSSASGSGPGGGNVDFVIPLDTGLIDGTASADPRAWFLQNWGQNLLALPRGGRLFEWQPATSYDDVIVNGGFDLNADNWTLGTNWAWSSSGGQQKLLLNIVTTSNVSQDIEGKVEGGKTYRLTVDFENLNGTSGGITIGINAGISAPAIVDIGLELNKTGSYSRLITMPAEPLDLVFQAQGTRIFLDNVTLTPLATAYSIDTAPVRSEGMIVAADRIVILMGTIEADGDYNPLLLRWSDRENNRTWIPDSGNVAGELSMAVGGNAITGLASREQNIFMTDSAVYSLVPDAANTYALVLLGEGPGAIGPLAITSHSGRVFWLTKQGVPYTLQSSVSDLAISQPVPIESGVQKDLFDNIAANQQAKIQCSINPEFNEFWILYPDGRDGDECSRYQAFNYIEKRWTTGSLARTTLISSGVESNPIGFGTDNKIYLHEKGTSANGSALAWHITTGYVDLNDGETHMRLRRAVPDFHDQGGDINLTINAKQRPQQATPITRGPYTFTTTTESVGFKLTARRIQLKWSGSSTNARGRFGAIILDIEPSGQKRT